MAVGNQVCANCGTARREDSRFCVSCGTTFEPAPPAAVSQGSRAAGFLNAAGVSLIILGGLVALLGLLFLAGSINDVEVIGILLGLVTCALGGLEIISGTKVRALSERWRRIGIGLALGVAILAFILYWVARADGAPLGFLIIVLAGFALHGYIIWALYWYRSAFANP